MPLHATSGFVAPTSISTSSVTVLFQPDMQLAGAADSHVEEAAGLEDLLASQAHNKEMAAQPNTGVAMQETTQTERSTHEGQADDATAAAAQHYIDQLSQGPPHLLLPQLRHRVAQAHGRAQLLQNRRAAMSARRSGRPSCATAGKTPSHSLARPGWCG